MKEGDIIAIMNELQFEIAARLGAGDVNKVYDLLMLSGLDDLSFGFWVWDIAKGKELYSPKFRATLQFSGEEDFPSDPKSWQEAIYQEDLESVIGSYNKHKDSGGAIPYMQIVRYNRKYKGVVKLMCHGKIVKWDGVNPLLMIGVHMRPDWEYGGFPVIEKFKDSRNIDVSFDEMSQIAGQGFVEIAKGCFTELRLVDEDHFIIDCIMDPEKLDGGDVILKIHSHSDFYERFEVLKGVMHDDYCGRVLRKGDTYEYVLGEPHTPRVREYTRIKIKGERSRHRGS